MKPKNANAVDDFMDGLRNALVVIGLQIRQLERAIDRYGKETRKCPYAKEKGAKCGHVV